MPTGVTAVIVPPATVNGPVPATLSEADLRRAAAALHPHDFDPPLAVRSLLTGLAANTPGAESLLSILTGRAGPSRHRTQNPFQAEAFRP
ncbi:hypothetical protein EV652_102691 [Kribbella steppae]|uniref:Uncharacterized protein n=1 Tax=Kribbella steppae TaxID=2512223 RepID=A0A4R2HTB5_9ACTN|nr:hypothetical protein EV652_102691 [Kribbella steppae]